jgi:alkylated DNA nucleotide flippase Atl1
MRVSVFFLALLHGGTRTHLSNRSRLPPHRVLELHKALRKQGLDVSKGQKGELRIAEDQAVEMRRRVELQVRVAGSNEIKGGWKEM